MTRPVRAFVGLGANLGEPARAIADALVALAGLPDTRVAATSSLYWSAPVDAVGPDFVNAVAELHTALAPHALLTELQALECVRGRVRSFRNAPRVLDLDLLVWGEAALNDPRLVLPHPRMHLRAFVLAPLIEIAPDLRLPGHPPLDALLRACEGQPLQRLGPAGSAAGPVRCTDATVR